MKIFHLPTFLEGIVEQDSYVRWLGRKAQAHIRRDRDRGNTSSTLSEYKRAIHKTVCESAGLDQYTHEKLKWSLISQYNNEESKAGGRKYKAKFALLPTVDHVGDGSGPANFKICGWAVNDAKGDLTFMEFVRLCHLITNKHSHLLKEKSTIS